MKNEILNKLLEKLERKYGDINDDRGCYVNGRWLSIAQIVAIIEMVDEEN